MIDPGTHKKGEGVEAYCRRRWGGSGWTRHLIQEGTKDGARFGDWKWWPHTLKAHQLVQYCDQKGVASTDKVNQFLFQAEYERGENISNIDTLVEIGQSLGLEGDERKRELKDYLTDDGGKEQVLQEINTGRRRYRISGVPFFIVGTESSERPYGFSGAQGSETFLEVFRELAGDDEA